MPEPFLGDGLIFEEALPVVWAAGPIAAGLALARLNSDNHHLLGAESSLDEVRVQDALKDESPALVHELKPIAVSSSEHSTRRPRPVRWR